MRVVCSRKCRFCSFVIVGWETPIAAVQWLTRRARSQFWISYRTYQQAVTYRTLYVRSLHRFPRATSIRTLSIVRPVLLEWLESINTKSIEELMDRHYEVLRSTGAEQGVGPRRMERIACATLLLASFANDAASHSIHTSINTQRRQVDIHSTATTTTTITT